MTDKPLVSVVMGIYNCACTLEKAVSCIQDQTYSNWELILCDDCSTDETYQIALSLAEKDSRITVLHNDKNLTLAPTLNKCIQYAKGVFIARMDGDDTCSPERLEKELCFLQEHPEYAIVSTNMDMCNEQGVFRTLAYKPEPILKDFARGNMHCHAACMVRAEAFRAIGGYSESKSCSRVEDYDLWVRMYAAGYRGYNLQEPLYCMFDSTSARKRRNFSNRVHESGVILRVCRAARLSPVSYVRVIVPIIKWFVPAGFYKLLHK